VKRISDLLRNVSVKNFFHLSLNQGVNIIIALVSTPYLFQTLEEENYGLVSLAMTLVLLFGMFVNYGFNLNIPKKLAVIGSNHQAKEELINEVLVTRIILAIVVAILLLVSIKIFGAFAGYSIILTYSLIQLFNDALYPLFILQGFDRLSWIAKANALSKIAFLGLVLMLISSPVDAAWVNFLLGSTGLVIHGGLLLFIYRKESMQVHWVSTQRIWLRLVENFQFFLSTVASYILINGGFILLKSFVSDAELGYYAIAQRVVIMLRMLPIFITQSILQKASKLYENDEKGFNNYLKKSQRNGLFITVLVCLIVAIFSKWVVRILAGEYIELTANITSILCLLPIMAMLNVSNMIRILVSDQKYILSKAIWVTTVFMLVLSFIGCYYYGSYGLAISLVLAEVFNYAINRYLLIKNGSISK